MNASASALEIPSLIVEGVCSAASFASFNPKPVIALISLITLIFLSPESRMITSNSVFSSAASTATAAPATATGCADTPNFSSNSFTNSDNYNTDKPEINSKTSSLEIAIFYPFYFF